MSCILKGAEFQIKRHLKHISLAKAGKKDIKSFKNILSKEFTESTVISTMSIVSNTLS